MPAAVTSGRKGRYAVESTWGTPPGGTYTEFNFLGETLGANKETLRDESIRADGQTPNVIATYYRGGGGIRQSLRAGDSDGFFRNSLLSVDWTGGGSLATTGSISLTPTEATGAQSSPGVPASFTRGSGSFITDGFEPGMWVMASGSLPAVNKAIYKVVHVTALVLYVQGNANFDDSGGAATTTITQYSEIANGIEADSLTVELEDADDTDEFYRYEGFGFSGFRMQANDKGILEMAFEGISQIPLLPNTTDASGNTAASTSDPFVVGNAYMLEGNPQLGNIASSNALWDRQSFKVLGLTMNVGNGRRDRAAWGTSGPALNHGRGDITATGTVRLYYNNTENVDDKDLLTKMLVDTQTGLAFVLSDAASNVMIFDLPRVKFSDGKVNATAKNQDVVLELDFDAYRNPDDVNPNTATQPNVSGTTIRIARGSLPS